MANIFKIKDVIQQLANEIERENLSFEEFTREFSNAFSNRTRKVENRESERTELPPIPAEVQPLDHDLEPDGPPFAVIVRNISSDGIGLMFGKDMRCKFLEIRVSTPTGNMLKTVIEVKHCTENGIMIGGTAMTELRLQ